MEKPVNSFARQERHARINFKEGFYHKQVEENKKTLKRFFTRVCILSGILLVSYFASSQFVSAYPDNAEDTSFQAFDTSETYVLQETGFVLKPSAQTVETDRSHISEVIPYTIEAGDTISGIASRFGVKTQTIMENNEGLSSWSVLKVGKTLNILPVDGFLHTVEAKDSIDSIAKKYKVKPEDILRQNQLADAKVAAGTKLIIPGGRKIIEVIEPVFIASSKGTNKGGKKKAGKATAPGSAPEKYAGVNGTYIWPANGKITQGYHRGHYAIDIGNRNHGPIYSMTGGTVIKASLGWNGGYGNVIVIDHGNGISTLYAHNEKLYVKVGDQVGQGQTIAWMGNTGRVIGTTGIHLHFEVIINGVKKNPLAYIGNQ